jgi:protocatechuate 3,4-dioxygenase beta subunit
MSLIRPALTRRLILAAPAIIIAPAVAQPLTRTPSQMEGPYYPNAIPADADADLIRVAGQPRLARGQPLFLEGVVRGPDGSALPGARVEIWQADAEGIYLHPGDARLAQRDPGFQGFGRTVADGAGRYAFRTIRPGLYTGRTRHIHLRAAYADGSRPLTTQVYFPDEPMNARDPLLRWVRAEAEALLTVRLSAVDGGQRAEFDIILG